MTEATTRQDQDRGPPGALTGVPQVRPVLFENEIVSAERAERRIALKLLIALAVVALLIGARLWFF
jgi:hypothetical protein